MSQLSGNLSMVAIMLSFDNSVPAWAASFTLSCSRTGHANIVCSPSSSSSSHSWQLLLGLFPLVARSTPKHPRPPSSCVRRYSIEPRSRRTHSLIFGMSLCVHLPSFDESHSSCHLLKRVSLSLSSVWCSSLLQVSVLVFAGTPPVRPIFLFSQELTTWSEEPLKVRWLHLLTVSSILICLSTRYAGMQSSQVGAPYS